MIDKLKIWIGQKMGDIILISRYKIINADDIILGNEAFTKM